MKLSAFLMMIFTMNVFATGFGQFSFKAEDKKVREVLDIIEQNSNYRFFYNDEFESIDKVVNLKVESENINQVLDKLLATSDYTYSLFENNLIVISLKNNVREQSNLQQNIVRGTVKDEEGNPIPGVTIVLKGTTLGTTTDINGNYIINVVDPQSVLVFSFMGYVNQEITVGSRTQIDISLTEEVVGLEEVVVIGYGVSRRSDLTGSTSSIAAQDVLNQPAIRVDQVLVGRSPGIAIQNNSAAPDGKFTIRIRGSNSLQGSNDPLIVVDGFIGGDLATINPNDISNIEILKDASSTAIYGSRGANGVILVSTKKGSLNKTTVEYNNFIGFQKISKKMDLLTAPEYAETVNINRIERGGSAVFTDSQIEAFREDGGTDWQDVVFREALQQSHQISVAGGTGSNTFYLSGSYVDNEGIIRGSSFNRYSFRSNIETNIGKKFKTGLNTFLSRSENHPVVTGGDQDNSPTQGALIWSPTLPVYDDQGNYTRPNAAFGPKSVNNPLAMAIEPINDNIGMQGELNSFVSVDIIKGLTAKIMFGTGLRDNQNSRYLNTKPNGGLGDADARIVNGRFFLIQNTNQINYITTIAEKHDINITGVFEQQREVSNQSTAASQAFSSDATTYNNLGLGSKPQVPSSSHSRKDILSYVIRVNYTLNKNYLASFTTRYDGASVFGNNKWGFFPSAALAWRVSGERFMAELPSISNLKIRVSYGITGSQAVSPYASLATLNTTRPYALGNGLTVSNGVGLGRIENPSLRWEQTAQLNIGTDLGLLKDRILLNVDYYNKLTTDLLMNVPMPMMSGYTSSLQNIGSVENKGFEFNLGGDPFIGELSWNTAFNIAFNKNKVKELSGPSEIAMGGTGFPDMGNTVYLIVGQPIGILKGYIQNGIWGTDEAETAASYGTIPGAPKYVDQNNDGKITVEDITIMGSTLPKFTYGWNNTLSYKNFDLNIFIQGSKGNKVFNLTRIRSERSSSDADAGSRRILNRWTPDNQDTDVPSFEGSRGYEQLQSSRWLEDGSYLRIKTITLGYNLPTALLSKIKISSARLFVSGVNLFTFTQYSGYDPEASTDVGVFGGIDMAPYPSQKSITTGINVKF